MRMVRCWSCSSRYCRAWCYGSPAVKTDTGQSCWCPCALPCASTPLSAHLEPMKEKNCLETNHCILVVSCWAGLQAVQAPGWACGGVALRTWCHSSHASDSSCSLCSRRTMWEQALMYHRAFVSSAVKCDSGTIISLPASVVRYTPEGTAHRQSGQPPAVKAPVSSLALALSRMLYGVIPAQSKPQELLSFACLSCCCWLMAVHEPPQLTLWWELELSEHQSWLGGIREWRNVDVVQCS